jgi:GcrA cell cycle regulator
MQSMNWPREHSDALREYLGHGMSFAEIAQAINVKFNTAYSRSAVLGRARRIGVERPGDGPTPQPKAWQPGVHIPCERQATVFVWPTPVFEPVQPLKLRCAEVVPRHVSLLDLEPGDCRYPFGGDEEGEAITFCAQPCHPGSSYCGPHFELTRGPGTASERAADAFLLWVVEAEREPNRHWPARNAITAAQNS